jgi:hypothetical protein
MDRIEILARLASAKCVLWSWSNVLEEQSGRDTSLCIIVGPYIFCTE